MKVLNIIVEGPTEREFIKECLMPYLRDHGILDVRPIGIETSPGFKGGDIRYARFKPNVINLLRGSEDMIVTSLIDYYALRSDFPGFMESKSLHDVHLKIGHLESSCYEDINDSRFIPYIQSHEFEGLLFNPRLRIKKECASVFIPGR